MASILLIAATLVVQAPAGIEATPDGVERVDVAYEELANRQPTAAIERIRANDRLAIDDPAALINLGAAHAMMGDRAKAAEFYRAAIGSSTPYELQLADGSWMDSRRIARKAVKALTGHEALAAR